MMFIICIQHDNEPENICTICTKCTCMLYTDDMIIFMYTYISLASYSMMPYWLVVSIYMLCIL